MCRPQETQSLYERGGSPQIALKEYKEENSNLKLCGLTASSWDMSVLPFHSFYGVAINEQDNLGEKLPVNSVGWEVWFHF